MKLVITLYLKVCSKVECGLYMNLIHNIDTEIYLFLVTVECLRCRCFHYMRFVIIDAYNIRQTSVHYRLGT